MATVMIGYSSSQCESCLIEGKPAGAFLNEGGHFTVAGVGFSNNTGGCQERWDGVVSTYMMPGSVESYRNRLVSMYPALESIPLENWKVSSWHHDPC